jgi:molybdopterin-guanine dinucleotide biosynthesis protein A
MGGTPKGMLRLRGVPLAARSLDLFQELFGRTLVVANDPLPWRDLGAPVVADVLPGKGAPGGLHAALTAARTGWVFVAACDMPFLAEGPIRHLSGLRAGAAAVVVRGERGVEGLHAFWSRAALPIVDRMLRQGDPSLRDIAEAVGARVVTAAEWKAVDPEGRSFANANTPDDLARLGLERP